MKKNLIPVVLSALVLPVSAALPIVDDFNDGNDAGWSRYEPIASAPFNAPGTWSFPAGAYRIEAAQNPLAPTGGPARAGSFRVDETVTDAVVTWDVYDWNIGLPQVFGALARVTNVGLGTTDGYGFVYGPNSAGPGAGGIDLLLISDEGVGVVTPTVPVTLSPLNDYRFEFLISGNALSGRVYDLDAPGVPVAVISGTDATYGSGVTGLFVASGIDAGSADATFDNFRVIPEPGSVGLLVAGALGLLRRRR